MFAALRLAPATRGPGPWNAQRTRTQAPMDAPLDAATPVVSAFYDRFPYPGDPLQDGPPPGYNWRWCVGQRGGGRGWGPAPGPAALADPRLWLRHGREHRLPLPSQPRRRRAGVGHQRRSPGGGAGAHRPLRAAEQVASLRIEQRSLLDLGEGPFYLHQFGGGAAPSRPARGWTAGPGPAAAGGGIAASVSVCRRRPLGRSTAPSGPWADGRGHRAGGAAAGAGAVRHSPGNQPPATASRAALGPRHRRRCQLRRYVPPPPGDQLRP